MLGAALQHPISKLKKSAVSPKALVPIHELQRLTKKLCSSIEAMNAADADCGCGKRCLRSIDAEETSYLQSSEVIKSCRSLAYLRMTPFFLCLMNPLFFAVCRNEVAHYKFDEKYSFLRKKVDESLMAPTKMGYLQHKFTVGVKGSTTRYPVCRCADLLPYVENISNFIFEQASILSGVWSFALHARPDFIRHQGRGSFKLPASTSVTTVYLSPFKIRLARKFGLGS